MNVYTTTGAFVPKAARKGTAQAKTKPITLVAPATVTKHSLNDKDTAAYLAETDTEKRAAILARKSVNRSEMTGVRVTVTAAALADFRTRVLATLPALAEDADAEAIRLHAAAAGRVAAAIFRSGIVALSSDVDDTDAIAESLFLDEDEDEDTDTDA